MTIDDNVDFLNKVKKFFEDIANNPSLNEIIETHFAIESLESAVSIMRKYKKIEQIANDKNINGDLLRMSAIRWVLENGKID